MKVRPDAPIAGWAATQVHDDYVGQQGMTVRLRCALDILCADISSAPGNAAIEPGSPKSRKYMRWALEMADTLMDEYNRDE